MPTSANPISKAVVVVVVVGGVLLLWCFDPRSSGLFPPCPLHYFTGLQCPGCGTTRALHALVHGDVAAAVRLNPLTMLLLALAAVKLMTPPLPRQALAPIAAAIMLCALVFAVVRNLEG